MAKGCKHIDSIKITQTDTHVARSALPWATLGSTCGFAWSAGT